MDRCPDTYELLFVDHASIPEVTDKLLAASSLTPSSVWEVISVTGDYTKDVLYRELGKASLTPSCLQASEYVHYKWAEEGIFDHFSVEILEPGESPQGINLAITTNILLMQYKLPTVSAMVKHLRKVHAALRKGGSYLVYFGHIYDGYLRLHALQNYSWSRSRKDIKASIKLSGLDIDWVSNATSAFMSIASDNTRVGKNLHKTSEAIKLGVFSPGELVKMAKHAGFSESHVLSWSSLCQITSSIIHDDYPIVRMIK